MATGNAPINNTTSINTKGSSGNVVNVHYKCLPDNQPENYGNFLVCWRSQNAIPWTNDEPDGYAGVVDNKSSGSQQLEVDFAVNQSYIVGYGVGPKGAAGSGQLWKNVCATAYIGADGTTIFQSPELTDFDFDSDSVGMNFKLPDGCMPKTNGAWVGIWQTGIPSYTTPPIAAGRINIDSSQGGAFINGVKILRRQTYTVALFTSGWKAGKNETNVQTAMACSATIQTP